MDGHVGRQRLQPLGGQMQRAGGQGAVDLAASGLRDQRLQRRPEAEAVEHRRAQRLQHALQRLLQLRAQRGDAAGGLLQRRGAGARGQRADHRGLGAQRAQALRHLVMQLAGEVAALLLAGVQQPAGELLLARQQLGPALRQPVEAQRQLAQLAQRRHRQAHLALAGLQPRQRGQDLPCRPQRPADRPAQRQSGRAQQQTEPEQQQQPFRPGQTDLIPVHADLDGAGLDACRQQQRQPHPVRPIGALQRRQLPPQPARRGRDRCVRSAVRTDLPLVERPQPHAQRQPPLQVGQHFQPHRHLLQIALEGAELPGQILMQQLRDQPRGGWQRRALGPAQRLPRPQPQPEQQQRHQQRAAAQQRALQVERGLQRVGRDRGGGSGVLWHGGRQVRDLARGDRARAARRCRRAGCPGGAVNGN